MVVFGGWWYRDEMVARGVQSDLAGYVRAFDRLQAGGDPYDDPDFLYTPPFVVLGNQAYQARGLREFVLAFRAAALLGVWVLVWLSLRPVRWPWPAALVAAVLVVPSGLTDNGIHCMNLTLVLAPLLAVGLLMGERRPLLGGLLAGSVNAIKPLGVTALAVAATPERARRPRREQVVAAGAAAVVIALWLLAVGRRLLPEMLSRARGKPEQGHHLAIHRALYQLGVHVPAVAVFAVVTVLGCAIAWRYAKTVEQRTAIGLAFSAMALPVVNPNTLLMSLPIQALALDRAAARWREAAPMRTWRTVAELALVGAAIFGIHGALGTVAFHDLPWPLGGLVTLIPHLEIVFLALYAVRDRRQPSSARR